MPTTKSVRKPVSVKLDPLASQLVRRYSDEFVRNPEDVVNGIVIGELDHAFEQIDKPTHDDSMDHVHEYVIEAAKTRIAFANRKQGT